MMLSSVDREGDAARCRELGVTGYLRKPITQSDLMDAILRAMGFAPRAIERPLAAAQDGTRLHPLRVLLAEDNAINRVLAVMLLERRGHTVIAAGDGRKALAALKAAAEAKETVDVVLMDVQMPEMDGLAATAAIRDRERASGGHIPIVALTAHALKEDQARCLAAGMDAYVSKPLRVAELMQILARLLPHRVQDDGGTTQ